MGASQAKRSELFISCSVITAHAMSPRGFRQRDVKFLLDLFSNWLEYLPIGALPEWQNTQIQRFLLGLVRSGSARASNRGKIPHYRLTRGGLFSLLEGLVRGRQQYATREQFFFLFYFIKNYRGLLEELIKTEGGSFPPALRVELEALCDLRTLIEQELREVDLLLRKLESRIGLASMVSQIALKALKRGDSLASVIETIESQYPYDLNSQRPLGTLIQQLPDSQRQWELTEGNRLRAHELWQPMRAMLEAYRKQVAALGFC